MFCKCCKKGLQFILTKTLALIPSCSPIVLVLSNMLYQALCGPWFGKILGGPLLAKQMESSLWLTPFIT